MDKQKKLQKLAKLAKIVADGDIALARFLFELDDKLEQAVNELSTELTSVSQATAQRDDEIVAEFESIKPTDDRLLSIIKPLIPEVKDGLTPSKEDLIKLIQPLIPQVENGKTPTKEELLSLIKPLIPQIEEDSIVSKCVAIIEDTIKLPSVDDVAEEVEKKVTENLPKLGEPIRDSLELLKGKGRLDKSAIRGLDNYDEIVELAKEPRKIVKNFYGGGGSSGGDGGASSFIDLTDTPESYTGQAGKVAKVNGTEDGLEFGDATDTDEKVKLSAGDASAGYLDDKIVEGNYDVSIFNNDAGYITSYTETDTLDSVTDRGATTTNSITVGGIVAPTFKADSSAGAYLQSMSGSNVALFGAGGGQNITFYDGVKLDAQTADRIAGLDASKNITALDTATYPSLTELSYVKGATSNIQDQIDAIDLSDYALLDGTNQPFTGDIEIEKSTPELKLSDTATSTSARVYKSGKTMYVNNTVNAPASIGEAAEFNGSTSKIQLSDSVRRTNDFTVSVWVKVNSFASTKPIYSFSGSRFAILSTSASRFSATFYVGGFISATSTSTFSTDTWYHIVVTKSSTTGLRLYVNGSLEGSNADNRALQYWLPGVWWGHEQYGGADYDGDLDEGVIWSRVLTTDETSDLYNSGTGLFVDPSDNFPSTGTSISDDLVALYHFNNDSTDSSGNGYNGTATNVTYATGKISNPGSDVEVQVIKSSDGVSGGERGQHTFGDTFGKSIIEGQSIGLNYSGAEQVEMLQNELNYKDNIKATFGAGSDSGIWYDGSNLHIDAQLVGSGNIILENIPTSDPSVSGAIWSDSGTLKISA